MTIGTNEVALFVYRFQFIPDLEMAWRLVVAFAARGDWNIWFKATQRGGPGDVDVAGCAFKDMVFVLATALMTKLH
ncbi:MAG: hypothetical protein ABR556_07625 [Pyrinomonadaceae bacterium]